MSQWRSQVPDDTALSWAVCSPALYVLCLGISMQVKMGHQYSTHDSCQQVLSSQQGIRTTWMTYCDKTPTCSTQSLLTISFLLPPDGRYWCHSGLEGGGRGTFSSELFPQLPDFIFKYSHRACHFASYRPVRATVSDCYCSLLGENL